MSSDGCVLSALTSLPGRSLVAQWSLDIPAKLRERRSSVHGTGLIVVLKVHGTLVCTSVHVREDGCAACPVDIPMVKQLLVSAPNIIFGSDVTLQVYPGCGSFPHVVARASDSEPNKAPIRQSRRLELHCTRGHETGSDHRFLPQDACCMFHTVMFVTIVVLKAFTRHITDNHKS